MGHNDHIDFELDEAITDLIEENLLEENSDAHGVSRQVIHSGYNSLSPKQKTLYDNVVVPALEARAIELRVNEILGSNPD
ncbi:hypothetical protein ACQKCH_14715 [Nubsella zeaxanthinifaciens]|uniref:hypothetical protein n=1 Tax=Nubsella zeaxanthinifaciens TaxID=392412 RepID=UPI003CFC5FBC